MTVRTTEPRRCVPGDSAAQVGATSLRYLMYGLQVQSDIRLPLTARGADSGYEGLEIEPDVVFRRAEAGAHPPEPVGQVVARAECPVHGEEIVVRRGPDGAWIWNRTAGLVHVQPDCRQVLVYPNPGADERVLGLVLAGQVSVFFLHQLGYPTLHASAVVGEAGAIGFLGPRGQGKSTMAAGFVQRGMPLLTDDVLPLRAEDRGICAVPSVPYMKLWPETVEGTFRLDEHLPDLVADLDKKLLQLDERFAFAASAVPIQALYVVQRYDATLAGTNSVTIRPLSARDAVAALLAQISFGAFLWPHERARLLPFYARLVAQAHVRFLSFPHGFQYQSMVSDRVLADVAELVAR